MFMVKGKYGFKRRGIYLMLAGIAIVIGFLVIAFYIVLFTSGSSLIKMENVSKIMITS